MYCYFCQRNGSEGELVFLGLVTDTIDFLNYEGVSENERARDKWRKGGINEGSGELGKNAATQCEYTGGEL